MESLGSVLMIVENLSVPFDRRVWMEVLALSEAGYLVSVICPKGTEDEAEYELLDGVHIYRHPLPAEVGSSMGYVKEYMAALKWEFKLARKVWKERGFDIIHICNPPDLLFLVAGWFKWFKGVKVVFDQHDLNPELYEVKFGKRDLFYYALRGVERLTFATADRVISTNESYREIALQRGKKQADRVFVVRSGPDLNRFASVPANPRYHGKKTYLVGYVGVMGEQEGIDYLLRSIHHIVHERRRHDIHFMLIGDGPAKSEMLALSLKLGISGHVEFCGRVPDGELIERLSSCDLCVNPDPKTLFNDRSTMNKILEYMALAKPIVQFDLLEGRRSAGAASLYAKPGDERDFAECMLRLLNNRDERARMGAIGLSRMREQLEWKHQIPQLLTAYSGLK